MKTSPRSCSFCKTRTRGLLWLCTNSLWEDTVFEEWPPGGLERNRLQDELFFKGQQTSPSPKDTCTRGFLSGNSSLHLVARGARWQRSRGDIWKQQSTVLGMRNSLVPTGQLYVDTQGRPGYAEGLLPFLSYLEAAPTMQLEWCLQHVPAALTRMVFSTLAPYLVSVLI